MTDVIRDAFAEGYAVHGTTLSDSAFELAAEMTHDLPLELVWEIAKYEGLMATLAERRKTLSKRWQRKIRPIPKAIAKSFPTAAYIATAHKALTDGNVGPDKPHDNGTALRSQRTNIAKGAGVMALRMFLKDHPEVTDEWGELVSLAEAEGQAEGIVQATALLRDSGTLPKTEFDLDKLYDQTLANLRQLDSYGSQAPRWITEQLGGLAGDMGRLIADGIARNIGPDDLLAAVNDVIAKGAGAQAYIDESIHFAMNQSQVAQVAAIGVDMFDYVAQPDACEICAPLDSSIAGPYTLQSLPAIPQHISCRCTSAEAGTVSS